jgi:hypothetical protein
MYVTVCGGISCCTRPGLYQASGHNYTVIDRLSLDRNYA